MELFLKYLVLVALAILVGVGFAFVIERKTGKKMAPLLVSCALVLSQAYVSYFDFTVCLDEHSIAMEPLRFLFQIMVLLLAFAFAVRYGTDGGFHREWTEQKLSYGALLVQLSLAAVWIAGIVVLSLQPELLKLVPDSIFFVTGFLVKLSGWILCACSVLWTLRPAGTRRMPFVRV